MGRTDVVAVVGATASGKSELALDLAQMLDGEIVNADAMQLYRGMDIGTAKIAGAQRRGVPHHQLDVLDVTDEASVAVFQREARADVADIAARGKVAVVVGGSGLYVRALLDDLSFPDTDPDLRAALEARLEREGPGMLHSELHTLDPAAAAAIDRRNGRRVVRALEVVRLTGRPFSASGPAGTPVIRATQLAVDVPRPELGERIARRARAMFDGGLLEETSALLQAGLARGKTASRAVGYAQARSVLAGEVGIDAAVEATVVATRQLARRQLTWFRRDDRIHWLPPGIDLAERARRLLA